MSSKKKKNIATVTAVILVLALGIAGTFAASDGDHSDGGFGEEVETSLSLHDDFSTSWTKDVRDRDIYVENTGDTSLYVRIRLDEFMRYGSKSIISGGKQGVLDTWKPHKATGSDVTECSTGIHDYFALQMGNDTGVKYKSGVRNSYNPALTDAEKTETTSTAKVVTIDEYLNATDKPDPCWVLDDDGYAYWYTQLKKTQATGLILNSITNTGLVDESYYYGINAIAEAVTEIDLNAWFQGTVPTGKTEAVDRASKKAIRLLKNLSPKYIEITDEMKANGATDFDSDNDGYLNKEENAEYEAEKGVTPEPKPEPDPDAGLNEVQKKVKAANTGNAVTIKNADGSAYGAETKWIILSKDTDEATLITENAVTVRQYHKTTPYPTWPASDIRAWLNGAYKEMLGTDLKQVLKAETLQTAKAYNDWTFNESQDDVYLLTETANKSGLVSKNPGSGALMSVEQLKCSGTADDENKVVNWWLRSPYSHPSAPDHCAAVVIADEGVIYTANGGSVISPTGVRPAVTISLK